jgi:cyanate permease
MDRDGDGRHRDRPGRLVGFQAAMLAAAAIMVVVLLPVVVIWIDPPQPIADPATGRKDASPRRKAGAETDGMSRRTLMRQPAFWTVTFPFALALLAQVGFIVHQIALLEPKIGHVRAGFAVALMTFMAVAGRLGLGIVIDRFNPRLVTAALLVSQAVALLTILLTDNMSTILAACAVFGFSVGNLITLPPLVIHREFDAASFAVATGLSTAISGTVCALGPALIGLVRGWSGDYDVALLLCVAFQLVAAAIVARPGFLIWRAATLEER